MKTVPSLVAASTVGVASAGLVFGCPDETTLERQFSWKKKAADAVDSSSTGASSSPMSRPATSSAASRNPLSSPTSDFSPTNNAPRSAHLRNTLRVETANKTLPGQRFSALRLGGGEMLSPQEVEDGRRDSVSSKGSWMRRFSTIPTSGQNSPRSSVGPESMALSNSSAAAMLSAHSNSPAQLPPNKLVKRQRSGTIGTARESRARSKTLQAPTLRRPATSHQRSATLHRQFQEESPRGRTQMQAAPARLDLSSSNGRRRSSTALLSPKAWRMYFDSRPTKLTRDRLSGRSSDGIPRMPSIANRIMPDHLVGPTLLKPASVSVSKRHPRSHHDDEGPLFVDPNFLDSRENGVLQFPEEAPKGTEARPRRSLSTHFTSPGWISRGGSLRIKRSSSEQKRHSSVPNTKPTKTESKPSYGPAVNNNRHKSPIMDPTLFQKQPDTASDFTTPHGTLPCLDLQPSNRNIPSPLLPLPRLNSFNIDLTQIGMSSSPSATQSPHSPAFHPSSTAISPSPTAAASPTSPSSFYFGSLMSRPLRKSEVPDRASTLIGSDNEAKEFISADDDDMDFQSETVYDSLRSEATASIRSQHTPLDAMFDESPPSSNGRNHVPTHDHTAIAFGDRQSKIIEEDEGTSTPVKAMRSFQSEDTDTPRKQAVEDDTDDSYPSSPLNFCLAATKDYRLSFDDEEDEEDWTRDGDEVNLSHQLSPPSSSMSLQRVSPSIRAALADVSRASVNSVSSMDRPKNNLFDWSEPPSNEKLHESAGYSRPRTAHKFMADGRGGRAVGRRGPTPIHIRSQSVPVVPDVGFENTKVTPKFGTWGLGAKGVSEDWDNDFEFDNTSDAGAESNSVDNSSMLVPAAIQASQASVVGHVGQIREVCLLVEDLKRLRLLGREKCLLHGASSHLWKEAEGIIALAVPDEDDLLSSPPQSPSSFYFEGEKVDAEHVDQGLDDRDVASPEVPFEVLNRHGKPTGFVYDGATVRRRSAFSPDDDIFGAGAQLTNHPTRESLRPPSNSPRHSSARTAADVARSVMENIHKHRSTSDPLVSEYNAQIAKKMPFDTTSLRDLVQRASILTRKLADVIREYDNKAATPEASPRRDREASPAFTRVFTDPSASPSKHLLRQQSNNSIQKLSGSIDSSPGRNLSQRMHMMTVV